jgi:hypothetical protein
VTFVLPATRAAAWQFYADVQADCLTGSKRYSWYEAERELGRRDLFYLLVRLLRRPDSNRDWLFDRCREVQAEPNGCLDLWAREHYKSTIITFAMTIQDILRDPEITVGIFSHTRPIAKGFLLQIKREFEDNEWLKHLYSDVLWAAPHRESSRWSEDGGLIVRRQSNPKEATIEAHGLVDGQPTSKHFRLRVYDDVVTRESVTTGEQIEKTTTAWELSSNLGVQEEMGGVARYIGTRYSLFDTYSVMLSRGAVKPRVYAATHNGRFDGRPVFLSQKAWDKKLNDLSRTIISSQQLQNPLADESATFRTEWLRPYETRPRTLNVYIMCDPSRGRSATSDNTAIAVVGVSGAGAKFLLDGVCHRMTLSQRWLALRNLRRKWSRARGVQHIAVGYERYGAQSDDEYFAEQMDIDAKRGIKDSHWTIAELNWPRDGTESKKERVERLEPDFRNGRFFLPREVWRDGRPMTWKVDTDPESKAFGDIVWSPASGLTSQQIRIIEGGGEDLVSRAIKCADQEDKMYDLTCWFIEEYKTFPFGAFKDMIDATSRVYDMDVRGPTVIDAASLEPAEHWDR